MRHTSHAEQVHKLSIENLNAAIEDQIKVMEDLKKNAERVRCELPHLQQISNQV